MSTWTDERHDMSKTVDPTVYWSDREYRLALAAMTPRSVYDDESATGIMCDSCGKYIFSNVYCWAVFLDGDTVDGWYACKNGCVRALLKKHAREIPCMKKQHPNHASMNEFLAAHRRGSKSQYEVGKTGTMGRLTIVETRMC